MSSAFLIYPHQLFEDISLLRDFDYVFLLEETLYFSEFPFHKQKIILHRASMKAYFDHLTSQRKNVVYIPFSTLEKHNSFEQVLQKHSIASVGMYDVVDDWLHKRITKLLAKNSIDHSIYESPAFLTTNKEFAGFFQNRTGPRKYFMNDFYIWQRKRLDILIEDNKPVGGSWSFDSENRKKLPKNIFLPQVFTQNRSPYVDEAREYTQKNFPNNFGEIDNFWCPVTHHEAKEYFNTFLLERFSNFGPYEDAVSIDSVSVFHSTISPLLNNGLLTPAYVVKQSLEFAQKNNTPISSVEGFIRQIIGWREYIRVMYVLEGRNIRTKNYFNSTRKLPRSFWSADTGIDPVDHHIHVLKSYAYTHHIPRLMILGNIMNLLQISPDDVYAWFMEMYIDAYDWVMVPNVYSMALYSDGGILTTKPYISSSNYILKMSSFTKGVWCEVLDGLFWSFVGKHYKKLQQEGRLGFVSILYSKMNFTKKAQHDSVAKQYIQKTITGNKK